MIPAYSMLNYKPKFRHLCQAELVALVTFHNQVGLLHKE